MARGRSVIEVAIIGDVKNLQKSFSQVNTLTGGLAGTLAKGFLGFQAIDTATDFIGDSLDKFDDFNDGFDRLSGLIGEIDAQKVKDIAFDMTELGLSADEVGTLAANFAALATAAGVSAPTIAAITPDMLKIASAVAATTGKTLDEVISDIGKAIAGQQKPVSEYGLVIDKAMNPEETLRSILDQLKEKFPETKAAMDDVAGAQDILTAKWDNFGVRVGENLEGPIHDLQLGLIYMADEVIPDVGTAFDVLGDDIGVWGRDALSPINLVIDALGGIGDAVRNASNALSGLGGGFINEKDLKINQDAFNERNYQGRPGGAN